MGKIFLALFAILALALLTPTVAAFSFRPVACNEFDEDEGLRVCIVRGGDVAALGGPIAPGDATTFNQVVDRAGRVQPANEFVLLIEDSTFLTPGATIAFMGFDSITIRNSNFRGAATLTFQANRIVGSQRSRFELEEAGNVFFNASTVQLDRSNVNALRVYFNVTGEALNLLSSSLVTRSANILATSSSELDLASTSVSTTNFYVDAERADVSLPNIRATNNIYINARNVVLSNLVTASNQFTALVGQQMVVRADLIANRGVSINADGGFTHEGGIMSASQSSVTLTGKQIATLRSEIRATAEGDTAPATGITLRFPQARVEIDPSARLSTTYTGARTERAKMAVEITGNVLRMAAGAAIRSASGIRVTASDLQIKSGATLTNNLARYRAELAPVVLKSCIGWGIESPALRTFFVSDASLCAAAKTLSIYGKLQRRDSTPYATASARVNWVKNLFLNDYVLDAAGSNITATRSGIIVASGGFYSLSIPGVYLSQGGSYEANVTFSSAATFACTALDVYCEDQTVQFNVANEDALVALPRLPRVGGDRGAEPIPLPGLDRVDRIPGELIPRGPEVLPFIPILPDFGEEARRFFRGFRFR